MLCQEAKGFLSSNLFQALQHHLSAQLEVEYPKPVGTKWQEQYRYARAYEQASSDMIKFLVGLKEQLKSITEKENEVETSIEDA